MRAAAGLLLLLTLASSHVSAQVTYTHDFCAPICGDPENREEPLPKMPDPEHGSRATQWSIVTLNLIKNNIKTLSPPSISRAVGLAGICMYDAITYYRPELTPFAGTSAGSAVVPPPQGDSSPLIMAAIDGAAYRANALMFKKPDDLEINDAAIRLLNGPDAESMAARATENFIESDFSADNGEFTPGPTAAGLLAAMRLGAAACDAVVKKLGKDGFDPLGNPKNGKDPTGYEPLNDQQARAGLTDCAAEIKDMDRWQPLCLPNEAVSTGNVGTEDCSPQTFLAPWAGRMTPFAIQKGDETDGEALMGSLFPPPYGQGVEYQRQMMEVLTISGELDDKEKLIAEHWADGPDSTAPPGHWWRIAAEAADESGLGTIESAKLMMLVGAALYDAGIAAWRVKTTFDYIRPLQMIQCGLKCVGNPPTCIDDAHPVTVWRGPYMGVGEINISQWQPYQLDTFKTPAFSGYVSGHSSFSGAAAEVLRLFFRDDSYRGPACRMFEEGESVFEKRIPEGEDGHVAGVTDVPNTGKDTVGYAPRTAVGLCWDSFTTAAFEAGRSRLYGGIHIAADNDDGLVLGRQVGQQAYLKSAGLFNIAN